jgi:hypothetical protein
MNFKFVYEKDKMIKGSVENMPTANDTDIIARETLEECKVVYFVDGQLKGSKTSNIPSENDEVLYSTAVEETEETEEPVEVQDEEEEIVVGDEE